MNTHAPTHLAPTAREAQARSDADPFAVIEELEQEAPELVAELAALAQEPATARERSLNLLSLADQVYLESLDILACGDATGVTLTAFGTEVLDAAMVASADNLSRSEREREDEIALDRHEAALRRRAEQLEALKQEEERVSSRGAVRHPA
jgi:hypothetical protein